MWSARLTALLNGLAFLFAGLQYGLQFPALEADVFGTIITVAICATVAQVIFQGRVLDFTNPVAVRLNRLGYLFLVYVFAASAGFFLVAVAFPAPGAFAILVGMFVLALVLDLVTAQYLAEDHGTGPLAGKARGGFHLPAKVASIAKHFLRVLLVILFVLGGVFAFAVVTGGSPVVGQITGLVGGALAGVFLSTSLATIGLSTKLVSKRRHPRLFWGAVAYGCVLLLVFDLPLLALPAQTNDANRQFASQFGADWDAFPADVSAHLIDAPYTHSAFYFGYEWEPRYQVDRGIVFANHSDDPDQPYVLRYDVYYSPRNPDTLAQNATIIFIHGGGWILGDTGMGLNKLEYLATQGYVVFDIQYRLLDPALLNTGEIEGDVASLAGRFTGPRSGVGGSQLGTSGSPVGNWTVRDMVQDIGEFTHYLAAQRPHDANLDNVILIGQSAGAHLAGIVGFGYNSPYWAGNFSTALTLSSVGLFYPPNNATEFFWIHHPMYRNRLIRGSPAERPLAYYYSTPSNLIDPTDPPCIMFHGSVDKMVPNVNSETILRVARAAGLPCVKVRGYFGGHAHDAASWHNAVATYFLERFLYLTALA